MRVKADLGIHHLFELLGFLACLYNAGKFRHSFVYAFLPFLLINLLVEAGSNILHYTFNMDTQMVYYVFNLVTVIFYGTFFYRYLPSARIKDFILLSLTLYALFDLAYPFLFGFIKHSGIFFITIGAILLVVYACFFFYHYLQLDEYENLAEKNSMLWISAGILIFYSGIAVIFSMFDFIVAHKLVFMGKPIYNIVPRYLSVILYSCFSIAFFVWPAPSKNK
jgi:hypothetical protein